MSTPLERAAEAIYVLRQRTFGRAFDSDVARAALEAAIDEGEIARVIADACGMGWDHLPGDPNDVYLLEAQAIKAHLLGGAE